MARLTRSHDRSSNRQEEHDVRITEGTRSPLPQVLFSLSAFQKMCAFIDLCPVEINGLGSVQRAGNVFYVEDVFVLDQVVNAHHAEMDERAYNRFVYELVERGEDPLRIKLQWHSHVDMPAYFSGEDRDTIAGYITDYMISLVMNKRRQYECRIDIFEPVEVGVNVPIQIVVPTVSQRMLKQCKSDIREKVKIERIFLPGTKKAEPEGETQLIEVPAEHLREALEE